MELLDSVANAIRTSTSLREQLRDEVKQHHVDSRTWSLLQEFYTKHSALTDRLPQSIAAANLIDEKQQTVIEQLRGLVVDQEHRIHTLERSLSSASGTVDALKEQVRILESHSCAGT